LTSDPAAFRRSLDLLDMESLRRQAQSGEDEDRRIVAMRQIQRILVVGFEDANLYFEREDPRRALRSPEVAALVQPENPEIQFLMARAWALDHDGQNALKALAKAAELGFSSPERIERDAAFAPLRQDPRYSETLAKIRAHSESANH
jgi:predicted Zn-dependent protease